MCFARWQSERCGAGCWSRLADASWLASQFGARQCSHATAKLHNAALHKVHGQSVASSFCVPAPLRALRVYAAGVMQNCLRWSGRQSVGAPRSLRALRAAACRPSGVLALWHMSGALRMVLVGGFAVHLVLAPAHPWVLLASQHRPRGLPVRPPRGLPQNRAITRRLTAAVCW